MTALFKCGANLSFVDSWRSGLLTGVLRRWSLRHPPVSRWDCASILCVIKCAFSCSYLVAHGCQPFPGRLCHSIELNAAIGLCSCVNYANSSAIVRLVNTGRLRTPPFFEIFGYTPSTSFRPPVQWFSEVWPLICTSGYWSYSCRLEGCLPIQKCCCYPDPSLSTTCSRELLPRIVAHSCTHCGIVPRFSKPSPSWEKNIPLQKVSIAWPSV